MENNLREIKLKAIQIQDLPKTVDDENAEVLLFQAVDLAKEISSIVDRMGTKIDLKTLKRHDDLRQTRI
jgi:hypothetical protein